MEQDKKLKIRKKRKSKKKLNKVVFADDNFTDEEESDKIYSENEIKKKNSKKFIMRTKTFSLNKVKESIKKSIENKKSISRFEKNQNKMRRKLIIYSNPESIKLQNFEENESDPEYFYYLKYFKNKFI